MRKILCAAILAAMALVGAAPQVFAAEGDNNSFNLAVSPGLTCLPTAAHARVTVSDLGPVQNLHLEVFGLTPNNSFTVFVTQHNARPFGLSWYQGEVNTNSKGSGVADYTGIFSDETFLLDDTTPVSMGHIGIWFADPNDAARAGCSGITTPFDGDHAAGILVFSSSNFPDNQGPLLQLGEAAATGR
jgi:hypothetical protein